MRNVFWGVVAATVLLASSAEAQTNLALGRPVTASPGSEYPAAAAVDGNLGTRWASAQGVDPQWIHVDLGSTQSIARVVLRWEAAYGRSYQIQTSNDAATWTTVYSTTTGDGGVDDLTGLGGSGRYVRMHGTVRATAWGYSLWELEVYGGAATATPTSTPRPTATATATVPPRPGGNLALNRPVTVSSTQGGFPGSSAIDANNGTRWASNSGADPQWIYVDLGAPTAVSRVRLNWEVAYGRAYQIQTSNNASTWTTIFTTTTGDGGIDDLTGLAGNGRYVRMNGTVRGTAFGYSLWELEIYGTGATPTATAPTPTPTPTPRVTPTATAAPTPTSTPRPTATPTTVTPTPSTCSGNANIALNKPAYAWFYQDSARHPRYATNGTRDGGAGDNRWASPWMPTAWIYVDLGAIATVNRVELYWEAAYATAYDIQTSNDAASWTTVRAVTGNGSTANVLTFTPAVRGRYVRMHGNTRATTFGYSLYEFEIYGCGDNPAVTPRPTPAPLAGNYVQVWNDEFDGTALDPSKWAYDPGTPQNGEQQQYTTDSQNVRVSGGMLILEAHDTQDNGQACGGCRFTSGRIITRDKRHFRYGRLAARMRLPVATGTWPAFWGLGTDLSTVNWPTCGEIDVMENIGYGDWISGALHGPGYFAEGSIGGRIDMPSTIGNFHEYRVDWDPTYVQWYVDGTLRMTANRADIEATRGQWVYDHDFFLILNLALGGAYPAGYNGVQTPFFGLPQSTVDMLPLRVEVDYVRVFQKQ